MAADAPAGLSAAQVGRGARGAGAGRALRAPRPGARPPDPRAVAARHGPRRRSGLRNGRVDRPGGDRGHLPHGPRHPRGGRVPRRGPRSGEGGLRGRAGLSGYQAGSPGDGLRLSQVLASPARRARGRRRAFRGEAGRGAGTEVPPVGQVPVERRDVRLARRTVSRRARPHGAGHPARRGPSTTR
jgi:hypothetical protein